MLPDRPISKGQKLVKRAKIEKLTMRHFGRFSTIVRYVDHVDGLPLGQYYLSAIAVVGYPSKIPILSFAVQGQLSVYSSTTLKRAYHRPLMVKIVE